jgi:hypothetical protein
VSEELVMRYGQKIQATYAANLVFMKEKLPAVFKSVQEGAGGVRIEASVNTDGIISMSLDGHELPLQTLLDQARMAMKFFENSDRPAIEVKAETLLPGKITTVDDHLTDYLRDYYFSHIDFSTRAAIDNKFVEAGGHGITGQHARFGGNHIPIVIVFGSGYGSHLVELLDRYNIRHMIVVDNDPAITRLSLGFTDYIAIFNNHLVRGTKFTMISSTDPEVLITEISQAIQINWPPFFVHGVAVFRNLRNIEICEKVESGLSERLWLAYRGWGFFDDELLSIRHSIANLRSGRDFMQACEGVNPKAAAFVVANGPSLDNLADLVKAHADKAVIVSCGTALSALHRLGIVPDFHLEMERPYTTAETLKYSVPPEYLAKIKIVAPNVVHPDVFSGCAKGLMFLKGGDTASAVFPEECIRVPTFPTVSNAAVSWLLSMGIKSIYLVGVDLGARDAAHHHSSHSIYFHQKELPENYAPIIEEATTSSSSMPMEAEANFGGKAVTNDILFMARMAIERDAAQFTDATIYNLNDGVLITGTKPLQPADFSLAKGTPAKAGVVKTLLANFKPIAGYSAAACREAIIKDMIGVLSEVKPIIALTTDSKLTLTEKIAMLHRTTSGLLAKHPSAYWALRGSLLHQARRVYEYMTFIEDEAKAVAFAQESFALISTFLDTALKEVEDIDATTDAVPSVPAQRRKDRPAIAKEAGEAPVPAEVKASERQAAATTVPSKASKKKARK